jgi:predicted NAD/FAD-binding protein
LHWSHNGQAHFLPPAKEDHSQAARLRFREFVRRLQQQHRSTQLAADSIKVPKRTVDNWLAGRYYPPDWCMALILDHYAQT